MILFVNEASLGAVCLQDALAMGEQRKLFFAFLNMHQRDLHKVVTQTAVPHRIEILPCLPEGVNNSQGKCGRLRIGRGYEPFQHLTFMVKPTRGEGRCAMGAVRLYVIKRTLHFTNCPMCKRPECFRLLQLLINASIIRISCRFSLLRLSHPKRYKNCDDGSHCLHPARPIRGFQSIEPTKPNKSDQQNYRSNEADFLPLIHRSNQSCLKGILA